LASVRHWDAVKERFIIEKPLLLKSDDYYFNVVLSFIQESLTPAGFFEEHSTVKLDRLFIAVFQVFMGVVLTQPAIASEDINKEESWQCSGWRFMGGDYPTNPWIPVGSTGSTEQEARDNIDCGMYQEAGISCRRVQD
jgi:hypothetical protein